jgi:glycosyltransferase involved in cell wall biosynthesis/SAM-dependent methyltransferase
MAAVREALVQLGASPVMLDQAEILQTEGELSVGAQIEGVLRTPERRIDLAEVKSVYLRPHDTRLLRPIALGGPGSAVWTHAVALDELFWAWIDVTPALVINPPRAMASNNSKPYQLDLIRRGGFLVPETLLTTDPEAVRAFWEQHGQVIYKSVSGVRSKVARLRPEHVGRLEMVATCPTQFQRRIDGTDHRVHVVGDAVFACEVISDADDYRYAEGQPVEIRACCLPDEVESRCRQLAANLGLPVAGIDLRRDRAANWYCFEVNPSPAFSYYEEATGLPIARAIASLLMSSSDRARTAAPAPSNGDVQMPLVSCIMPTYNRRAFVRRAIEYFLRQSYANRELIVVDDGDDAVGDLMPRDDRIRYVRLDSRATIGGKRNLACSKARGNLIAHWDDDDWQAPHRLEAQVKAILSTGADVCGIDRLWFYDPRLERAWQYVYPPEQRRWLAGSTLCYQKSYWLAHPFPDINLGEDTYFIWAGPPERMTCMADSDFHVGIIHGANASPKDTVGLYWQPRSIDEIRRLLGDDFFQHRLPECNSRTEHPAAPADHAFQPADAPAPREFPDHGTIRAARSADLLLPEFAAFNQGASLPRMRQWELPFALYEARLGNTMAVLDCTINPVDFAHRIGQLFPHVLYRHWNPIQGGKFELPMGVPDAAFDRVFCINTLEHLLKEQREALIAAMARVLKPDGQLILTSDYYFDSSWSNPAYLGLRVMKTDRAEIFNGWNKVTPGDWIELCARHGLVAEPGAAAELLENDSTLFRNLEPHAHACIGGSFRRANAAAPAAGKKVVLALLTWNTRDISIESVRAYLREARMLRRLGVSPLICVCDNGSTDGTGAALRAFENEMDIPYRFLFNDENRGNSIARNQIIDVMLEWDGDYLLFMDGDIEIVPCSSFAMLRHMENNGSRLGCLGADAAWQTPQRHLASPSLWSVTPLRRDSTNLVAWTQYGMFRREVFSDGIRLDESAPFDRPGWGFEDNDLAFQLENKGYVNQRFFGMTYLHRKLHSSFGILRAAGTDPFAMCQKRKQYVIDKWSGVKPIEDGPLEEVRRVHLHPAFFV